MSLTEIYLLAEPQKGTEQHRNAVRTNCCSHFCGLPCFSVANLRAEPQKGTEQHRNAVRTNCCSHFCGLPCFSVATFVQSHRKAQNNTETLYARTAALISVAFRAFLWLPSCRATERHRITQKYYSVIFRAFLWPPSRTATERHRTTQKRCTHELLLSFLWPSVLFCGQPPRTATERHRITQKYYSVIFRAFLWLTDSSPPPRSGCADHRRVSERESGLHLPQQVAPSRR